MDSRLCLQICGEREREKTVTSDSTTVDVRCRFYTLDDLGYPFERICNCHQVVYVVLW